MTERKIRAEVRNREKNLKEEKKRGSGAGDLGLGNECEVKGGGLEVWMGEWDKVRGRRDGAAEKQQNERQREETGQGF